jgi:hypothetical protein
MVELEEWTERAIIQPLYMAFTHGPEEAVIEAKRRARLAVRGKVLESYHNGQKAAPRANQRPMRRF